MMQVDLRLIAYVSGPNTSLWNRRARCRRLLCTGSVSFHAKAPGMVSHDPLTIDERIPDPLVQPRWLTNLGRGDHPPAQEEQNYMCNHYRASGEWRTRMDEFSHSRLTPRFDFTAPRANVQGDDLFPGHLGEILVGAERRLDSVVARWCFMPLSAKGTWADWLKARRGCNNARGEEADGKWPFQFVAKSGRCLIPGEAFFEWDDGPKGAKNEYRFAYPDERAFFFAGLCGHADPPDAGKILTYTMVTKAAGGDTSAIGHKRQPVVLHPEEIEAWLDPANTIRSFTERHDPPGTFAYTPVRGPKAIAA